MLSELFLGLSERYIRESPASYLQNDRVIKNRGKEKENINALKLHFLFGFLMVSTITFFFSILSRITFCIYKPNYRN